MLAQIVEPGVAAHEEAPVLQRLDVEIGVAQRRGVADDFLDDIGQGDDSFGPAEFIDHDGEPLGVGEKTVAADRSPSSSPGQTTARSAFRCNAP